MKCLTAVATVFMPLTFLTGVFGMIFEPLPSHSLWVLLLVVAALALIPTGMWLWMRRAQWF
jgi:magnesium transporter